MKLDYQPDAVVITLSREMMMERGYKNWLREFLETMAKDDWTYWFRTSGRPKHEVPSFEPFSQPYFGYKEEVGEELPF